MAYGYDPYSPERNDRGDSFNGNVGTSQPASVRNRVAQPSQAAPARGGGNPYADAVAGTAPVAQALRGGVPQATNGAPPAPPPQGAPNGNQSRYYIGLPPGMKYEDWLRNYEQGKRNSPIPPRPDTPSWGGAVGPALGSSFTQPYYPDATLVGTQSPGYTFNHTGNDAAGNETGFVISDAANANPDPDDPFGGGGPPPPPDNPAPPPNFQNEDGSTNYVAVAEHFRKTEGVPATPTEVRLYMEWAYDPTVSEAARQERQSTPFKMWYETKPTAIGSNNRGRPVTQPNPEDKPPGYDENDPEQVAAYYRRFNPEVQAKDVTNYREWAYDPTVSPEEQKRRQATHFNDWWKSGRPVKGVPKDPTGGYDPTKDNWDPANRYNPQTTSGYDTQGRPIPSGGGSGSASGSTTPGTGTAPGDSNSYLARLEASIRNRFQETRRQNLDQFRHQGGVNNLRNYGASPEILGEMYQAMARDENNSLLNPMLGVAEAEQGRVLQKYGIDVGAETSRYAAQQQAAAAGAAANAAYRSNLANIDWQRERFGQEFPWEQEKFRTQVDQDTFNAYLEWKKWEGEQGQRWTDTIYNNSPERYIN